MGGRWRRSLDDDHHRSSSIHRSNLRRKKHIVSGGEARTLTLCLSLSDRVRGEKFWRGFWKKGRSLSGRGTGGQNFFSNTNAQRKIQHRAVLLNHDSGVAISGHPVSKIFCLIYKTSLGTFGRADPETPAGFGLSSFVLFCAVRVVITLSVCPVCSIGSIIALATAGQNSGRSGRE